MQKCHKPDPHESKERWESDLNTTMDEALLYLQHVKAVQCAPILILNANWLCVKLWHFWKALCDTMSSISR